ALFGRVSCDSLMHEEGGYVELCADEGCSEEGCAKVFVVPEGKCGSSFTGFAAASWRCVSASDVPPG
ncbi:unnamed protein product, partial [Polarella glacialis]